MKSIARARSFAALLMVFCLLATPLTALAKKGEKNYNRGLQYEAAQQWDKAAQEYALAVAALPSDTEYQLHYQRAVFNASQVFMQRGRALADQGDYAGAFNAFRQAYGYDPVNLLAASEMERMLRLQREKEGLPTNDESNGQIRRTALGGPDTGGGSQASPRAAANGTRATAGAQELPARAEQLKVINYSGELEPLVRRLADELSLNVVFDRDFSQQVGKRQVSYNLRDVTTARALDYIFAAQGLFFQKLDRRTILVADQSKRPQYQQLVLRTFYLNNTKPEDARTLIQQALPANAGRQPAVMMNKETNSITVRDTPENIRLIAELLPSIDKDRAEVVMEVSIYEVSRNDLLQIGNQLGTADTLGNLGGNQPTSFLFGGRGRIPAGAAAAGTLPVSLGAALLLPASTLTAFQEKGTSRLVFSTQVHAFDDEKSETRIGQKVPVQTASVTPFGFGGNGTGTGTGTSTGGVFSGGFPVIQYEDTGLSLDFTPKVYPNGDVQVKMVIDTKDAIITGSGNALTPTFTQRRITGIARVPNNRTVMIASIAQDRQSNGRSGLPLLGLIPILGRFVTAPRRNNTQSDIVMTMTPRVLRAPTVTPSDEESRPTGSIQTPQSDSLEAMVRDADRQDQLAAARKLPTNTTVQLPPVIETAATEQVTYVPAPSILVDTTKAAAPNVAASLPTVGAALNGAPASAGASSMPASLTTGAPAAKPVALETSAAAANNNDATTMAAAPNTTNGTTTTTNGATKTDAAKMDTATPPTAAPVKTVTETTAAASAASSPAFSAAEMRLVSEGGAAAAETRVGAKQRVALMLKTDAPLGLAAATLRFDPRVLKVNGVSKGTIFDAQSPAPIVTASVDPKGILLISVAPAAGSKPFTGEGVLLYIEVEALAPGESALSFDAGQVHLIATDGRSMLTQASNSQFKVIQ